MEVAIREAEVGDVDSICLVNRRAVERLTDRSYSAEQVSAWASAVTPELYPVDSEESYFLVAERDERIVALGWMKTDADEYFHTRVDGEVTGMYVDPDIAGLGIGAQLYDELESFAIERDVESLGLWASLNAISFYEKHGYRQVIEQIVGYGDGIELPVFEMRKQLD